MANHRHYRQEDKNYPACRAFVAAEAVACNSAVEDKFAASDSAGSLDSQVAGNLVPEDSAAVECCCQNGLL